MLYNIFIPLMTQRSSSISWMTENLAKSFLRSMILIIILFFFFYYIQPTIFGTVASDQSPKDISSRRVSVKYIFLKMILGKLINISMSFQGHPQTVSGHQVISSSDEFDSDENVRILT